MQRKPWWPHVLWLAPGGILLLGVLLACTGIAWAVLTGTAVPYQDPTPAMAAYEQRHIMLAGVLAKVGFVIAAFGTASGPLGIVGFFLIRHLTPAPSAAGQSAPPSCSSGAKSAAAPREPRR